MKKLPEYVSRFKDRHGKARYRFRKRGHPKTGSYLPDPEKDLAKFHRTYERLLSGQPSSDEPKGPRDTLTFIAGDYLRSDAFREKAETSRARERRSIGRLVDEHGHRVLRIFDAPMIELMMEGLSGPGAKHDLLKTLSVLFEHNKRRHLDPTLTVNHTKGIKRPKLGKGAKTATLKEVEQYRNYWPIGTIERLAMELVYRTSQRIGGVCMMHTGLIGDEDIMELEHKTDQVVFIPFRGVLAALVAATPLGGPWLIGSYMGKRRRSEKSAAQWFSDSCTKAGLPHLSAHSFRKGRLTHLANRGASAHGIMAVSGHVTLSEAQRYTSQADRRRLAIQLMEEESV